MQIREHIEEFNSKNLQSFETLQNMPEIDFKRYTEYLQELSESFESRFKDFQNYKKAFCFASSPKYVEISDIEEIGKLFNENVSEAKSEFLEIKSAYDCFDIDP